MVDVFISYSRQNIEFAETLFDSLNGRDITAWVDWKNIPRSAGWWDEIKRGIDGASTFVFVMSEASLSSAVCTLELAHAIENGKRIIPVVIESPDFEVALGKIAAIQPDDILKGMLADRDLLLMARDNRTTIGHINWVFFVRAPQGNDKPYESSLGELIDTVNTDLAHNRRHARLLVRAREWQQANHEEDLLLIGAEVREAEQWLHDAQLRDKEPTPTDLHRDYITTSRRVEDRRRRLLRNLRVGTILFAVVGIIAVVLALGSLVTSQDAQTQANQAATQAADAEQREADAVTAVAEAEIALTQVSNDVLAAEQRIESLRLASLASAELSKTFGDVEIAALLAIRALNTAYTAEADTALVEAADRLYTLRTFVGHTDSIADVDFSPDGSLAISSSSDGTARLWDVSSGEELRQFIPNDLEFTIGTVDFSPDGATVLTGGCGSMEDDRCATGNISLWDVETGELVRDFEASSLVTTAVFTPNGQSIISNLNGENYLTIWDIETGDSTAVFEGVDDSFPEFVLSPDGKYILPANYYDTLTLWDIETGTAETVFEDQERHEEAVAISPDGQKFAVGSRDTHIYIRDLKTGDILHQLAGHGNAIMTVEFSPDGQILLSVSLDGTQRLWDVETGELLRMATGGRGLETTGAYAPDGKTFLTGSNNGFVRLWDADFSRWNRYLDLDGRRMDHMSFLPDQAVAVLGNINGVIQLWDSDTGEVLNSIETDFIMYAMGLSNDGTIVVSASCGGASCDNGGIQVWDIHNMQLMWQVSSTYALRAIKFTPDDQSFIGATDEGLLYQWDTQTGELIQTLEGHTDRSYSVDISPDGKLAVSGGGDTFVYVWNLETGDIVFKLEGHTDLLKAVAFSPDGQTILSAGFDDVIRLWDVETGELLRTFAGHTSSIEVAKFTPDGQSIVSGGYDDTIRIWHVETGENTRVFSAHTDWITNLAISADGKRMVSGSNDDTVRAWYMDVQDLIGYACSRITSDLSEAQRESFEIADQSATCPQFAE